MKNNLRNSIRPFISVMYCLSGWEQQPLIKNCIAFGHAQPKGIGSSLCWQAQTHGLCSSWSICSAVLQGCRPIHWPLFLSLLLSCFCTVFFFNLHLMAVMLNADEPSLHSFQWFFFPGQLAEISNKHSGILWIFLARGLSLIQLLTTRKY